MTKEAKIYNGEKIVSSVSGVAKIGQLHTKVLVHWEDPEESSGEGGGRGGSGWGIHVTPWLIHVNA